MISIIIPVYNSEKYIDECLNSVINQSYREIEIIVINDGSLDKSKEIIEQYAEKDRRIRVVNKKNTGQGDCRNIGIKLATGDYILFLDSDDFIVKECLENLQEFNSKGNYEIIVYNADSFYDNNEKKYNFLNEKYFRIKDEYREKTIDGRKFFNENYDSISPCLKLYKSKFLKENNILFPRYTYGEDIYFWTKCCIKANKVIFFDYSGYCRRIRLGSVSNTSSYQIVSERIKSINDLKKIIENENKEFYNFLSIYSYRVLGAIIELKKIKEFRLLINQFKKINGFNIILESNISFKKKFIVKLIKLIF